MRKNSIKIAVMVLAGFVWGFLYFNSNAQTDYRGILRGHQIQMEVKSLTAIGPYTAVKWDTSVISFVASARGNLVPAVTDTSWHDTTGAIVTQDSMSDTLAMRGSVFYLRFYIHQKNPGIDTVVIYGDSVRNPLFNDVGSNNYTDPETLTFDSTQLSDHASWDSTIQSNFAYSDVDSIRLFSKTLEGVSVVAVPMFYVTVCDSGSPLFAGITYDSIEIDTTGAGTKGGTPAAGDSSSGHIVIKGIAEVKARGVFSKGTKVGTNAYGKVIAIAQTNQDTISYVGISLMDWKYTPAGDDSSRNIPILLK